MWSFRRTTNWLVIMYSHRVLSAPGRLLSASHGNSPAFFCCQHAASVNWQTPLLPSALRTTGNVVHKSSSYPSVHRYKVSGKCHRHHQPNGVAALKNGDPRVRGYAAGARKKSRGRRVLLTELPPAGDDPWAFKGKPYLQQPICKRRRFFTSTSC